MSRVVANRQLAVTSRSVAWREDSGSHTSGTSEEEADTRRRRSQRAPQGSVAVASDRGAQRVPQCGTCCLPSERETLLMSLHRRTRLPLLTAWLLTAVLACDNVTGPARRELAFSVC